MMASSHLATLGRVRSMYTLRVPQDTTYTQTHAHVPSVSSIMTLSTSKDDSPTAAAATSTTPITLARCRSFLDAYVSCMEGHKNVTPAAFQVEWCEEEKSRYLAARDLFKAQQRDGFQ